ncbi:MAG: phosphatidylserine decarboxylase family protein [Candidatus Aminicenantia bacterium]
MVKEGIPFIIILIILVIIFLWLKWWILFIVFLLFSSILAYFFRDPKRKIQKSENLIISPADGKIIKIENIPFHPLFQAPTTVVSIFLSFFDVHINRAPISGIIRKIEHKPGEFFPAFKEKSSLRNEQNIISIQGNNIEIVLKQIAGIIARRVKCWVKENEKVQIGQKIGVILLGSRVEIFLPREVLLNVKLNQKVKAGQSIIARIK